jgi:hypothetical protein
MVVRVLGLAALVLSLVSIPSVTVAQVAGISGWHLGTAQPAFVVMRNGETIRVQDGFAGYFGSALASRPAGEWVAGFTTVSSASGTAEQERRLWAITNTGHLIAGDASSGWSTSLLNLFTVAGVPQGEALTMQGTIGGLLVLTSAGDVFQIFTGNAPSYTVELKGNIGNIPTSALPVSWGALKDAYRR